MYTQEQRQFIIDNNCGKTSIELAELFNKHFNTNIMTKKKIQSFKSNNKLKSGIDTKFKKGQKSWCKGKKGVLKANKTSFKKGQKSHNYKPLESERVKKDGYTEVKITDKKWILKQRLIWEQHFGKIPKGYMVLFADKDKSNFDLDNLILVKTSELLTMNKNNLVKSDKDLTKTGHLIAKVINKTTKKQNKKITK